ncbi:hypothetical protein K7X08_002008 [Anisodus acutangulus]|uniref:FBD domain-containing protein n=1 Tax=Anisodus acutangulus TaxID=402998 RepID=A0A9Q1R5V0_9SOLA|nr:hypothetical protein K7X08_002008 [Anisodus acutangulus]
MWRSSSTFSYPDNFPRLDNLRELELDLKLEAGESLLFFTFFSKASPFLSSFTARRISDVDDVEHAARLATRFVHKNLKVVKLIGFIGCRSDFNLALHLLEIVGSLKEIILQPTSDCHHPNFMRVASIEERSKELESKLPPGAKLKDNRVTLGTQTSLLLLEGYTSVQRLVADLVPQFSLYYFTACSESCYQHT